MQPSHYTIIPDRYNYRKYIYYNYSIVFLLVKVDGQIFMGLSMSRAVDKYFGEIYLKAIAIDHAGNQKIHGVQVVKTQGNEKADPPPGC